MSSLTNDPNFNEIYDFAIQITRECEDTFREGFHGVKDVLPKGEIDLVTDYDHRIQNYLEKRILEVYPDHRFLGEEGSNQVPELTDEPTWIIDPIDGTHNFIRQIPYCSISVAFTYRKEIICGIVASPMTNEVFSALKGNGSYLNGAAIAASKIENISTVELMQGTRSIVPNVLPGLARVGSAALALAHVANGTLLSFYVNFMKPWDTAAGILILREAGGVVYAHDGSELNIMVPDLIGSSNEWIAQNTIQLFAGVVVEKPKTLYWDEPDRGLY